MGGVRVLTDFLWKFSKIGRRQQIIQAKRLSVAAVFFLGVEKWGTKITHFGRFFDLIEFSPIHTIETWGGGGGGGRINTDDDAVVHIFNNISICEGIKI